MFASEETIHSSESGRSYRVVKALGHGAFGEVLLAQDACNPGLQYGVKQLYMRDQEQGLPLPVQRELDALRQLQHPNIVELVDVASAGPCFYLVQELCTTDLAAVLQAANHLVPPRVVKAIVQQLLAALAACHAAGFMHRDVKPSNVLITVAGVIKLADFGLAVRACTCSKAASQHSSAQQQQQQQQQLESLTDPAADMPGKCSLTQQHVSSAQQHGTGNCPCCIQQCQQDQQQPQQRHHRACCCLTSGQGTRWYRAPELLYGSCSYGPEVDIWAAGLLLAELLGLAPLLPGQSDIDQLARLHQLLGSISLQDWPEAQQLPDWHKISFGASSGWPLSCLLPDAPEAALHLLQQMLVLPPERRVTATAALQHDWLAAGQAAARSDEVAAYVAAVLQQPRPQISFAADGQDSGPSGTDVHGWTTSSDEGDR